MTPPRTGVERITLTDARDALLKSGYLIEHRLESILRARNYYVETNEAYPDPDTGKSRELDIYAMSALRAGPQEHDFIFGVLLIECINNPQPVAFITKDPLLGFLHHHEVVLAGLPVKMPDKRHPRSWQALSDYLAMDQYHHYCEGRVATQYCSFALKKRQPAEWMATHEDSHFDAFRKLCAAVDYHYRNHFESWTWMGPEHVNIEFYYPILVVQGDLLDIQQTKRSIKISKTQHIQYRMSALTGRGQTTYQIDVVTEQFFPDYLDMVDRELSKTRRLLRRRHRDVRNAIARIARTARRFRSPDKMRSAMEF